MAVTEPFELGIMKIGGETILIEEITVSPSMTVDERYTSDSHIPKEIILGKKKIEWTVKRAFDGNKLSQYYEDGMVFEMILYNNDTDPVTPVMKLDGCIIEKDTFGPLNGDKTVAQELSGRAATRTLL
ncbi:MAG: hypothetical protein LLG05_09115 [Porphyromonadaceae bacterium]|nr:hypothetical protein [Porphyromonadaceae bacterium]